MNETTVTILSQASVHAALLERVNGEKFSERHTYVGGSEVGGCALETAWKKCDPSRARITDPQAAGRILAGNVLENAIVQLVRSAFGGVVRETGHAQAELAHESAPLRCHPDGKLTWQVEWREGMRLAYLNEKGEECFTDAPPSGPGTLEIKTAGGSVWRKYVKTGLPPRYLDQTQTEMGLSKTGWTLLVLVNRENIAEFATFLLFFDEAAYQTCVDRATRIMQAVRDEATMPEPEPERGWCAYCGMRDECPAHATAHLTIDADAVFPEDVALDVEVKAEEYQELKPLADRADKLKDELRDLYATHGVQSAYGITLSKSEGRSSVDTKRLQTEFPDVYSALLRKGSPSFTLRIARKRA